MIDVTEVSAQDVSFHLQFPLICGACFSAHGSDYCPSRTVSKRNYPYISVQAPKRDWIRGLLLVSRAHSSRIGVGAWGIFTGLIHDAPFVWRSIQVFHPLFLKKRKT
jgi:hypothetical protein